MSVFRIESAVITAGTQRQGTASILQEGCWEIGGGSEKNLENDEGMEKHGSRWNT